MPTKRVGVFCHPIGITKIGGKMTNMTQNSHKNTQKRAYKRKTPFPLISSYHGSPEPKRGRKSKIKRTSPTDDARTVIGYVKLKHKTKGPTTWPQANSIVERNMFKTR